MVLFNKQKCHFLICQNSYLTNCMYVKGSGMGGRERGGAEQLRQISATQTTTHKTAHKLNCKVPKSNRQFS